MPIVSRCLAGQMQDGFITRGARGTDAGRKRPRLEQATGLQRCPQSNEQAPSGSRLLPPPILLAMWLLTSVGFFSIVRKTGESDLTVRARARSDLEELIRRYLPSMGPIVEGTGTDYPYRAQASPDALAAGVARIVEDIDYPNFKDMVADRQGFERAHVYGDVWSVLRRLTPGTSAR